MYEERLLTIEDDPDIAALIKKTALEAGFQCMELCNSSTLPAVYQRFKPDVIMLDILMPEMDGFDVLHFLKQEQSTAQILILSGSEYGRMAEKIGQGMGLTIVGTMYKPFRVAELRLTLQEIRHDLREGSMRKSMPEAS